jgi:hypothetical protein
MEFTGRVKVHGSGGSFWERPERTTFFGLLIDWVNMKKLLDIVEEVFLESFSSDLQAILKALRAFLSQFNDLLHCSFLLLISKIYSLIFFIDDQLIEAFCLQIEKLSKKILSPFDTMESLFGEHLQGAVWDITCVIFWVSLRGIGLSLMIWKDNLNMTLGSQGTAIN